MQEYLITRLLMLIPTVFGITVVVFLAMRLIPGDPIDLLLADDDSDEACAAILLTVLGCNLFGDGLRDTLDSRLQQ